MSNHYPITVDTCADCPLRVGIECHARAATVYLDPRRDNPHHAAGRFGDLGPPACDPPDVSTSIAGAPPPDECLLRDLPVLVVLGDWRP